MIDHASGQQPPAVELQNVSFGYGSDPPAIERISLRVEAGARLGILGPNGGGKSTLLKVMLGLLRPHEGDVRVLGLPPREAARRRLIGYLPQRLDAEWSAPLSVRQVAQMTAGLGLPPWRRPSEALQHRVNRLLELVGMGELADRPIGRLSGGQQQRVFIARALVQEADLYFLDEPMAGVDATTERAIVRLLEGLRERGKTLIVVHHDLQTVRRYFDWIVILNVRIIAQGPVAEAYTAEHLRRAYGGQIALIEGIAGAAEAAEGSAPGVGSGGAGE